MRLNIPNNIQSVDSLAPEIDINTDTDSSPSINCLDLLLQSTQRPPSLSMPSPRKKTSVGVPRTKSQVKVQSCTPALEPDIGSASTSQPMRHPSHWYLDGSVIIQMQNILFKLHRSGLARKSTYFANLFANVLSSTPENKAYGGPLIEVDGDAKDFAILLDAIDDTM